MRFPLYTVFYFSTMLKDINRKKWIVQIRALNKKLYLGRFNDIKKAALAYNRAALKYHGEFAHLNEVWDDRTKKAGGWNDRRD